MRIGFTGSHRTGKTTLTEELASDLGYEPIITEVSKVFKELGYNPAETLTLKDRMKVQSEVLLRHTEMWKGKKDFITDRTPLDFIAYTVASIRQEELTDETNKLVADYIETCNQVAKECFDGICYVRPGIIVVGEDGKASTQSVHIDHIDMLIFALHEKHNNIFMLPPVITDLDQRVVWCRNTIVNAEINHKAMMNRYA